MGMRLQVALEDRTVIVEVEVTHQGWRYRFDEDGELGPWVDQAGRWLGNGELLLQRQGRQVRVGTHVRGDAVALQVDGHAFRTDVLDPRKARANAAGGAGEGEVRTPMPGVVVRIPVAVGQEVHVGQVLIVVEAMKMENEFKSAVDGTVAAILVEVGQALEANTVLVQVEQPGDASAR